MLTKDCLLLLDLKRLLLAYKTQLRVHSENPTQFPAYPGLLVGDQELMGLQTSRASLNFTQPLCHFSTAPETGTVTPPFSSGLHTFQAWYLGGGPVDILVV